MRAIQQLDMEHVLLLEITRALSHEKTYTDHYSQFFKKLKLLSDYTDLEESTSVKATTRELDESSLGLPGDQTLS